MFVLFLKGRLTCSEKDLCLNNVCQVLEVYAWLTSIDGPFIASNFCSLGWKGGGGGGRKIEHDLFCLQIRWIVMQMAVQHAQPFHMQTQWG